MIKMRNLLSLVLAAGAALSLTAPAFAADYSYTTKAPQDYYGSTSYEDVYGSQYNYGGRNVVDYDIPELEYGQPSTTQTGVMERTILPGLQQVVASTDGSGYGLGGGNGGGPITELVMDDGTGGSTGTAAPVIPSTPQITVPSTPAYTSVQGMAYKDGSIGTVSIPKLGPLSWCPPAMALQWPFQTGRAGSGCDCKRHGWLFRHRGSPRQTMLSTAEIPPGWRRRSA